MELDLYVALHYSTSNSIMHWNSMSTFATAFYAVSAAVLDISLLNVLQIALVMVAIAAFALLFKPLLVGIARAMVLVVRPKLSRDERLADRKSTRLNSSHLGISYAV